MSAINFITANPYVPAYQQAVSNFGQEDRAADRAVRERETWLRAENDRVEVAKALDRAQEAMRAKPAAPAATAPSGPQPPVPAQMPPAPQGPAPSGLGAFNMGPGPESLAPQASPAMPTPQVQTMPAGGLRSVSSMPKQVMPMPGTGQPGGPQVSWGGNRDATVAQINSITDPAERAAAMLSFQRQGTMQNPLPQMQASPAATVGGGGSPAAAGSTITAPPESASLRMVNALGSHPALNQTRMSMMQAGAQSQDSRQNQIADKVWELASTNDPGKLAAARQLAMQSGINLPEAFWTDAGTRARIHGILQGMKDQGVAAWDIPQFIQSQPGMNQTPGGQVALEAANLDAPIKGTIQTGGEYTTNPDGSKTYKPGPMYLNRGRTVEQATDAEGNQLTSTAGVGRAGGAGAGGAGGESKQIQFARWRAETLRKAGFPEDQIARIVAGGSGVNKPLSQNEVLRAANALMKSNVDPMGRPKMTLAEAIKDVRAATGADQSAQPAAPTQQPPESVDGSGSPAAAQPAAQPAQPQNAPVGRVTPALVKWAKTSKSQGVSVKAMIAELVRQKYTKEEARDALRQAGY